MIRYNFGTCANQNWLAAEDAFDSRNLGKCEAIFCQGNGYLGQRAALEEDYVGQTRNLFVTGTFNRFDENEVTELPNLPDLTRILMQIDDHPFSMDSGTLESYRRTLSLKTGELIREVIFQTRDNKQLQFRFNRFVSMSDEHLLGTKMTITALSHDVRLTVESGIDGRVTNTGSQHFCEGDKRLLDGRFLRMTGKTTQSGVVCSLHAVHRFSIDGQPITKDPLPIIDRRYLSTRQNLVLEKGQSLTMEKLCSIHTSRDMFYEGRIITTEQVQADGYASIAFAAEQGYDALFARSKDSWARLWEAQDIQISTEDGFDQLAVRFAIYHLNIMVKKEDARVGIAAKGLSGEGYKGHSFWDTEIFILPFFTFTQPSVARTLLTYRFKTLYGARKKAQENNFVGAMYPWESAWISDGEVTPLWGAADIVTGQPMKIWTGLIEQHISADIAFAVWQYYAITGDQVFMDECGYEIIIDTARFWASRATWNEKKGQYEYLGVIGPDEYKEHVDNNAFTNYMAAWNMRLALRIIDRLEANADAVCTYLNTKLKLDEAAQRIQLVLDKLYLPTPNEKSILPQFDDYFSLEHIDLTPYKASEVVGTIYHDYNNDQLRHMQVSKQADVLVLFFLLEELFSHELKKQNYFFYEERTLHDSSLSKSTHAVLAADLGLEDIAYSFFQGCASIDMGQNMRSSNMGIHSASMGGLWQSTVYGFGGVRMKASSLHIAPRLPKKWSSLCFSIIFKGQRLIIHATQEEVHITNTGSSPVSVIIYGQETAIQPGQTYVETCSASSRMGSSSVTWMAIP